jgi:hypothetical protein
MLKKLCLILVMTAHIVSAQIGGTRAYRFLDIPMTARGAALGGNSMAVWGDDINLVHSNPALLNRYMDKQAAFNYCSYVGDVNLFHVVYAHQIKEFGTAAISMQAMNYGTFQGFDENGNKTSAFKAADYCMNLNFSKTFADTSFQIGGALKTFFSQYDTYNSVGNAVDFGITYHNSKTMVASIVVKNIGVVWKDFSGSGREPLPIDVQFGMSQKVAKAPFRLFFVYDQLLKWNVSVVSPVDTTGRNNSLSSSTESRDSTSWQKFSTRAGSFIGNFSRHLTVGTEIIFSKNFQIRIGYNFRRQSEMSIPERRGVNGLSLGFGLRVKRFGFSYSFSKMAFPGNSNIFSINYSL